MAKLTPMMQQYLDTKQDYPDCILLFRLGDFYETFFEDAQTASRELELVLTGRDCGLEERAPMCGVPHHAVNTYVGRLINKGYKVAICDQLEDPAQAKGIVKRGVTRVITPGTVIEDAMLTEGENNYILSLFMDGENSGIAYCDVSTGEFNVLECNGQAALLGELTRINPREMIIPDLQVRDVLQCMQSTALRNIFNAPYYDWAYEYKTAYTALLTHFKVKSLGAYGCEGMQRAISAAGALMQYLNDTQKNALTHINRIVTVLESTYMALDASTCRNLELTQTIMEGGKKGSLLWLLDQTKTAQGARLLKKCILQPLKNINDINNRLDAIEEIVGDIRVRNSLLDYLHDIYDFERIISRISYNTINARDCLSLKKSLAALPYIKEILNDLHSPLLSELNNDIDTMDDVYDLLEHSIHEDAPIGITEGSIIKQGFNDEVDRLMDATEHGQEWLMELETRERETTGIKNLKVRYNKVFGYYIEVTKSYLSQVPYRYMRKQTLVGSERFITAELKEMEESILGSEQKRAQLEYELFIQIREMLAQEIERIQKCAGAIAMLDVILSFALVAYENGYTRPVMSEDGIIALNESRHPVVEKAMKDGFVPNDVYLDMRNNNLLLITGPNMAGKSTYMRQTGLIVLMAHIGCFVPAKEAKICLVDRIFTRVGASDDLAAGQSTFMVEMNELANILHHATPNSLLILDEIGRGTSTIDGLSIAWASVEYIISYIKAKTLFATHFHELVEMAGMHDEIRNCSIAVKEIGQEIVFLHRIVDGGTDKSFGIEVARLAGLPKEVIAQAKIRLREIQENEFTLMGKPLEDKEAGGGKLPRCLQLLEQTDINKLTPIEALNMLHTLQSELRDAWDE